MKIISLILLCLFIAYGYGSSCTDLSGVWKNELGSNLTIVNVGENRFTGFFHTGVENTPGAARITSKISGMMQSVEHGKLLGFNVLWNRGATVITWIGQCIVCQGKAVLFTTWQFRTYLPVERRWLNTNLNYDIFFREIQDNSRYQQNQGPQSRVSKHEVSSAGLKGKWVSTTGNTFDINEVSKHGEWTGRHHTHGKNDNGGEAAGNLDGNDTFTAIGFVGLSDNKIKGWAGHIDNEEYPPKVLESSWLEHTFHHSCSNPRKYVRFGLENYEKSG